jgi:hypothetical protein
MKYEIEIRGYGGEIVMGKLTKAQYDFWIDHADRESEELHSHLFWDPWSDEEGNPVTDDEDPRFLGNWYEIDDIVHCCSALQDNCTVTVTDEDGNEVWTTDDPESEKTEFYDPGEHEGYVFKGWSSEKGTFFGGEFVTDKFDPAKLKFFASNIDNEVFIDQVEYNNEEVYNDMGGDTTGKGYGYFMYES